MFREPHVTAPSRRTLRTVLSFMAVLVLTGAFFLWRAEGARRAPVWLPAPGSEQVRDETALVRAHAQALRTSDLLSLLALYADDVALSVTIGNGQPKQLTGLRAARETFAQLFFDVRSARESIVEYPETEDVWTFRVRFMLPGGTDSVWRGTVELNAEGRIASERLEITFESGSVGEAVP